MNFLRHGRRSRADSDYGDTNTPAGKTGAKHPRREKTRRPLFDINSGNFNRRPSFGQWFVILKEFLDCILTVTTGSNSRGSTF